MTRVEDVPHIGVAEQGHEQLPVPDRFPVVTVDEPLFGDEQPSLPLDTVARFHNQTMDGRVYERFHLRTLIGGLHYVLYLHQATSGYDLGFKTEEYEYALVDLSREDRERLTQSIRTFVESVHARFPEVGKLNLGFSANDYHASDVEACAQILASDPAVGMSRQELMQQHPGGDVFSLYEEQYGRPYQRQRHGRRMDVARKRYFRQVCASMGEGWNYVEDPHVLSEATLRYAPENPAEA